MSAPRSANRDGSDLCGAAPLYKEMIDVDERSMSDGEDVLMTAGMRTGGDKSASTSPCEGHHQRQQQSPPGSRGAAGAGTMRKSKLRSLKLPLTAEDDGVAGSGDDPRRSSRVVMPLFATEVDRGNGAATSFPEARRRRRTSLSCVSLGPEELASLKETPRRVKRPESQPAGGLPVPAFAAPNATSTATTAVFERTNFLARQEPARAKPRDGRSFPVTLHVYDLASGLLDKYSEALVGKYVAGVYHSAVVCYGMEFYFEGGVGVAGAGRTRFGPRFKSFPLGSTTKPLPVFLEWISRREVTLNQVHDYHLTRNNCHHFCGDAAEFLLGHERLIPRFVFTTVEDLLGTERGTAVQEVMELTIRGTQHAVARLLHTRVMERQASMDMVLHAVTACGVLVTPPNPVVLFCVQDRTLCTKFFTAVEPYIEALVRNKLLKPSAMKVYKDFARQLVVGDDTLYGHNVVLLADIFAEMLVHNPPPLWGPPLNALRLAVLHKSVTAAVVFHPKLLQLLLLAARDLPQLLPDGRLGLLRLLCNLSCSSHGAVALQDARFASFWVSAVGQGLMDDSGTVVYTAACLANNLAISAVTVTTPSLRRALSNAGDRHPLLCLLTVALYNLNHRTVLELPEPAFNMLLLAIFKIMASSTTALDKVVQHTFPLRYGELLKRADSNESRALLCIMKTLDDLYRW